MSIIPDSVMTALASVIDPRIRRPITELNMASPEDVTADGPPVSVRILLTTTGCPLHNTIIADVRSTLDALEGIEDAIVEVGVMSSKRKKALREKLNGGYPEREIPSTQSSLLTCAITVTSDKNGVGKSSMTANLTVATVRSGLRAGVMDADIYGSPTPRILGVTHELQTTDGMILPPSGA